MKRPARVWRWALGGGCLLLAPLWVLEPEYAYVPSARRVENPPLPREIR
jgi:hypothetical protein